MQKLEQGSIFGRKKNERRLVLKRCKYLFLEIYIFCFFDWRNIYLEYALV